MGVGADAHGQHQVAHEHAVGAAGVRGGRGRAGELAAQGSDRLGPQRAVAPAQGGVEAQHVRSQRQQARHVRRLQGAAQPDAQPRGTVRGHGGGERGQRGGTAGGGRRQLQQHGGRAGGGQGGGLRTAGHRDGACHARRAEGRRRDGRTNRPRRGPGGGGAGDARPIGRARRPEGGGVRRGDDRQHRQQRHEVPTGAGVLRRRGEQRGGGNAQPGHARPGDEAARGRGGRHHVHAGRQDREPERLARPRRRQVQLQQVGAGPGGQAGLVGVAHQDAQAGDGRAGGPLPRVRSPLPAGWRPHGRDHRRSVPSKRRGRSPAWNQVIME